MADVKVRGQLNESGKTQARELRSQLCSVLSEAYRAAGVSSERISQICRDLGIERKEGLELSSKPLTSREVKTVLMTAQKELGGTGLALVANEIRDLRAFGMCDENLVRDASKLVSDGPLATVDGMLTSLKAILKKMPAGSFPGLTAKNAETFVKANFAQLKQLAFDHAYRSAYATDKPMVGPAVALAAAVSRLMQTYGSQGKGLTPGLMPVTQSMKLVMDESLPKVDKSLVAKYPPPDSMNKMLTALRGHSKPDSPTARRLSAIADRLESAWVEAARSQNDKEHFQEAVLHDLEESLGKGFSFLLGYNWDEAGILGEAFLKRLDSQVVSLLSANGKDATPKLADVVTALRKSATGIMKQDDLTFLAVEVAKDAIRTACTDGTGKVDFNRLGEKKIGEIFEHVARIAGDLGSQAVGKLLERAFNGTKLDKDVLMNSTDSELKAAYTDIAQGISKVVDSMIDSAQKRREAIEKAGAKLPQEGQGLHEGNTELSAGDPAIRCKLVLLIAYYGTDKLRDLGLADAVTPVKLPKSDDPGKTRQELLEKVDRQVAQIPDSWFNPIVNVMQKGIAIGGPNDKMIPVYCDGFGVGECPLELPALFDVFKKDTSTDLFMSGIVGQIHINMKKEDHFDFSKCCAVYAGYHDAAELIATKKDDVASKALDALNNTQEAHVTFLLAGYTSGDKAECDDRRLAQCLKEIGPKQILDLMKSFGLKGSELSTGSGCAKFMLIRMLLFARQGNADGLAEWGQRMFGVDFRNLRDEQFKVAAKKIGEYMFRPGNIPADPLDRIATSNMPVGFLAGLCKFDEAKISSADVGALMTAVGALRKGGEPQELGFGGKTFTVANGPDGKSLVFTLRGNPPLQIRHPRSAADMLTFLRMQVASDAKSDRNLLLSLVANLGDVRQTEMPAARARELMVRILSTQLNRPMVAFADMSQLQLYKLTTETLKNPGEAKEIPPAKGYYSDEVKVQLAAYDAASDIDKAKVAMPPKAHVVRSEAQRKAEALSAPSIRTLFGELFMNADVTLFDAEQRDGAQKGGRILALVESNSVELKILMKASDEELGDALAALPEKMREQAKGFVRGALTSLMKDFDTLGPDEKLQRCAEVERALGLVAESVMGELQETANRLFPDRPSNAAELTDWKAPLESKGAIGIDVGTPEGQIVSTVLKHYFTDCSAVEKRAMMASYVRNGVADGPEGPSEGQQLAAALKGAGPVLQKMMQGLPINSFGEETQKAIKDMKCNLLPIPDSVIRAQLLDLVRNSNGNILSVSVLKPIGSATVAQALLCHITTQDAPQTGKDVVIKLQRPNSQLAALREQTVIADILGKHLPVDRRQALGDVFQKQFEGILKEFDFTVEAENIDVARINYNVVSGHEHVHSMDRSREVIPNTGTLLLEKVDGVTLESSVDRSREVLNSGGLSERECAVAPGGPAEKVLEAENLQTLIAMRNSFKDTHERLLAQRLEMVNLIDLWFDKGLMGDGFFHADLHAGNMMTHVKRGSNDKLQCDISFIDFGNVQRMSKSEQKDLLNLVICCGQVEPADSAASFIATLKKMAPGFDTAVSGERLAKMKAELCGIFAKGGTDLLLTKLAVAVSTVQSYGVMLPQSVGAFLSSVERLRNGLASIDAALAECELKMSRLGRAQPPDTSLADLNDAIPDDIGEVRDVLTAFDKFMTSVCAYGEHKENVESAHEEFKSILDKSWNDTFTDQQQKGVLGLLEPGKNGGKSVIWQLHDYLKKICPASESAAITNLQEAIKTAEACKERPDTAPAMAKATYNNLWGRLHSAISTIASACRVGNHDEATGRDSFERVLANVLSRYEAAFLLGKLSLSQARDFVKASHLDLKNAELQQAAKENMESEYGKDDMAKTAEAICSYVGTFRLPGGTYATKVEAKQLAETLNFFVKGMRETLHGHDNGPLTDREIQIAARALTHQKVAGLPFAYMVMNGYEKNKDKINAEDHPILKAVQDSKTTPQELELDARRLFDAIKGNQT